MDKETILKHGTGEAHALVAEVWFTFLGFVAATAVLHAAAEATDAIALSVIKWTSYVLLFRWVNYKIDLAIWAYFPQVDPLRGKPKPWQTALSVWISSMIMFGVYFLVFFLIEVLLGTHAA